MESIKQVQVTQIENILNIDTLNTETCNPAVPQVIDIEGQQNNAENNLTEDKNKDFKEQAQNRRKTTKTSTEDSQKQRFMLKIFENNMSSQPTYGFEQFRKGFDAAAKGCIQQAEMHQKAKLIQKFNMQNIENSKICDCCGFPANAQKYSLRSNYKELSEIGVGYAFYFIFFKFVIFLNILISVPFGISLSIYCFVKGSKSYQ